MSINDIIQDIHNKQIVEQIVYTVGRDEERTDLDDLIQDIYVILLTKQKKLIQKMYEANELSFYIAQIAVRQLRSKTSPYYRQYKRSRMNTVPVIDSLLKTDD